MCIKMSSVILPISNAVTREGVDVFRHPPHCATYKQGKIMSWPIQDFLQK